MPEFWSWVLVVAWFIGVWLVLWLLLHVLALAAKWVCPVRDSTEDAAYDKETK